MVTRPEDVELQRLQLRFAAARVDDARAVQRLAQSIETCGQLIACVAVGEADIAPDITSEIAPLVLIDGYRRVAALRQLGRDSARVECWSCTVSQALAQVLARANARAFAAIEEALLLRELMDAQHLSQREAARQCGRDVSWVHRRLQLLGEMPEGLLLAVRRGEVSAWAATRVFAPLARANAAHAQTLLGSVRAQALSTRELHTWFAHYRCAQRRERERMVEHPRLLLDSVRERVQQHVAGQLKGGPEGQAVAELGHLQALLERVRKTLAALQRPLGGPLGCACTRVRSRWPEVEGELRRLCDGDDADRATPQRAHAASPGPLAARDQSAAAPVA